MPIKDTPLKNSTKNIKASTSGQTRPNVITAQASVKSAPKNSSLRKTPLVKAVAKITALSSNPANKNSTKMLLVPH